MCIGVFQSNHNPVFEFSLINFLKTQFLFLLLDSGEKILFLIIAYDNFLTIHEYINRARFFGDDDNFVRVRTFEQYVRFL